MSFVKYPHLERFGNEEVEGIEIGTTYVFPKLDGTNAQLWMDENGNLCGGSRNRVLSLHNDNAGFLNHHVNNEELKEQYLDFFRGFSELTLFGEWLVPHSLKTYREDAWRKFYIFDIYHREQEAFYDYERMADLLDAYGLNYLPPIAIVKNGTRETYEKCLEKNVFLIKDGMGTGEGIVIKNYGWQNKFGRTTWAKIITNEFKEIHHKEMGAPVIGGQTTEEKIVDHFVTTHLVDKVVAKITLEKDGWSSKYIGRLLQTVYYDLVKEEIWEILKKFNNPRIDFSYLQRLTISKIKELRKDLF